VWKYPPMSGIRDIAELVGVAAAEQPDRLAVVEAGGRSLTWGRLEDEVGRIATGLGAVGVVGGHRVLLAVGNRLEFVTTYLGVLRAQAVAVPVNPGSTPGELARMLADSGARMAVADADTVAAVRDAGFVLGEPVDGLISGQKSVLVLDPDGAVIELTQAAADADTSRGALFGGIRIAAIDAEQTGKFLTGLGFDEVSVPEVTTIAGEQFAPGATGSAECVLARYALPEDGEQFSLTVVQHPGTPNTPVPWGGNRQGLYRCALRVENVAQALAEVPPSFEVCGEPVWCPLPGTKIEGLYIAFLRSPDGVVFEFVERPLKFFSKAG